uniref:Uncharacterized protein n=1 Tax=Oryza glumipatula TaxID=40148 RepID=A0A0E0A000_9ORYZ
MATSLDLCPAPVAARGRGLASRGSSPGITRDELRRPAHQRPWDISLAARRKKEKKNSVGPYPHVDDDGQAAAGIGAALPMPESGGGGSPPPGSGDSGGRRGGGLHMYSSLPQQQQSPGSRRLRMERANGVKRRGSRSHDAWAVCRIQPPYVSWSFNDARLCLGQLTQDEVVPSELLKDSLTSSKRYSKIESTRNAGFIQS